MNPIPAWQLVLVAVAGWMNRHQQEVIAYIQEENSILKQRLVRTIRECCLRRMIFFGEDSLRGAITKFLKHYHHERNHHGLENRLIDPAHEVGSAQGSVACLERLGGVLRYYYRDAA